MRSCEVVEPQVGHEAGRKERHTSLHNLIRINKIKMGERAAWLRRSCTVRLLPSNRPAPSLMVKVEVQRVGR
jgi:hypothetical protein